MCFLARKIPAVYNSFRKEDKIMSKHNKKVNGTPVAATNVTATVATPKTDVKPVDAAK